MHLIRVRFYGPTNTRGARFKVSFVGDGNYPSRVIAKNYAAPYFALDAAREFLAAHELTDDYLIVPDEVAAEGRDTYFLANLV